MVNKQFYIEFGKVAYAMMMADGEIQDSEITTLRAWVQEELAPLESLRDEFGTDLAHYVTFSYEAEDEIHEDVEDALNSFLHYIHTHQVKASPEIRKACHNILSRIARSYGRVTKVEKSVLERFDKEFVMN